MTEFKDELEYSILHSCENLKLSSPAEQLSIPCC